jgi:hypothetical protein
MGHRELNMSDLWIPLLPFALFFAWLFFSFAGIAAAMPTHPVEGCLRELTMLSQR